MFSLLWTANTTPADAAGTGCVVGVSSGSQLNVRSGPGVRFPVIGGLAADACGVSIQRRCNGRWCQVVLGSVSGWASRGFLRRGPDLPKGRDYAWELLGKRTVDFKADRDVIQAGKTDGRFRAIQLLASGAGIYVFDLRVVYANGRAESIPVRSEIRNGARSRVIDLTGKDRYISRVELVYRSKPTARQRATIEVFGVRVRAVEKQSSRKLSSGRREIEIRNPANLRWELLGTKSVQFKVDRDVISVGRREGRYRAIQLAVRGADTEILDLRVVYGNDRVQDVPVRSIIRSGATSKVIDLRGRDRFIKEVRVVYKRRVDNYDRAIVEVYGLHVDAEFRPLSGSAIVPAEASDSNEAGFEIGVLTCNVSGGVGFIFGSTKDIACNFNRPGRDEVYFGSIDRYGLDIGYTSGAILSWAVLAGTVNVPPGALEGTYGGASGQATLGVGVGANALIGGSSRSIVLQPLSAQAQQGANIAFGIAELTLRR
ncbi:MAG: DUF992 domain-containing protein [Alphaproteobacteria bacterium]|nr:DUF992 domain-containing protein [Alphaproteobacteria bacterium]